MPDTVHDVTIVDGELWQMNKRADASRKHLASQGEVENTLEDVEAFIAVAMDVRRRTELGSCRELRKDKRAVRVVADGFERLPIRQEPERFPFASTEMNPALRQ
jgi:hypothetical protein